MPDAPEVSDLEARIIEAIGPEPAMMIDGARNPEHLRWMARLYSRQHVDSLLGKADMGKGNTPASMVDWISTEATLCGIDPKQLHDLRTEAHVYEDATRTLLESPEELFAQPDAFLEAAEAEMDKADRICAELAEAPGSDADRAKVKVRRARIKKWTARIHKVRAMRDRARNKLPKGASKAQGRALDMAHPLRYMIWVGRPGGSRQCFIIGRHHCLMAQTIYYALRGEILTKGKWIPAKSDGAFLIVPPGHCKTTLAAYLISLMISQNNRLRCVFMHAQEEMAQLNLQMVATNFQPTESAGRRNLAMFPGIEIEEVSTKKFRLKLAERQKSPTIIAVGITAAKSGADCDLFWPDDPCDQKLAEQPAERDRAWNRLGGTWRSRKRGSKGHFEICTTTLWHHDDPTARMLELIRADKAKFVLCRLKCGGPEDGFTAIWPEEYPSHWLKAKYAELRNPRLYATVYQSNPQPEELRKVKKLRYYLPDTEEHRKFIESAIHDLSLDPTATSREKSDKASFVWSAMGDIVTMNDREVSYRKVMRILDARQFHATQSTGVEEVCGFAGSNRVDYVHAETRSGFNATAEMLEAREIDVIRHDPGNRSKERRLMDVAPMLDDALSDKGFEPAVIEFPGKMGPLGNAVQDDDSPLLWLEKQVLDFGVCQDDHGLDALTQVAKFRGPELGVGQGQVTRTVQAQERIAGSSLLNRMLRAIEQVEQNKGRHAGLEDLEWQTGQGDRE